MQKEKNTGIDILRMILSYMVVQIHFRQSPFINFTAVPAFMTISFLFF